MKKTTLLLAASMAVTAPSFSAKTIDRISAQKARICTVKAVERQRPVLEDAFAKPDKNAPKGKSSSGAPDPAERMSQVCWEFILPERAGVPKKY
ncbi:MAG: hypothetical protein WC861_02385 [Candidatus Micrarchaeia archaeon]